MLVLVGLVAISDRELEIGSAGGRECDGAERVVNVEKDGRSGALVLGDAGGVDEGAGRGRVDAE